MTDDDIKTAVLDALTCIELAIYRVRDRSDVNIADNHTLLTELGHEISRMVMDRRNDKI
jgi:hypothetical protein